MGLNPPHRLWSKRLVRTVRRALWIVREGVKHGRCTQRQRPLPMVTETMGSFPYGSSGKNVPALGA